MNLNNSSKTPLRNLLSFGLVAILITWAAVIGSAYYFLRESRQIVRWTQHTRDVQNALLSLERDFFWGESLLRAYLITDRQEFLIESQRRLDIDKELDNIEKMVSDNPVQVQNMRAVRQAMSLKKERYLTLLDMRTKSTKHVVEALDSAETMKTGKAVSDATSQMVRAEEALMLQRQDQLQNAHTTLSWILGLGGLLTLGLGIQLLRLLSSRLEPLGHCATVARLVGEGNLSLPKRDVVFNDEVGQVTESLNLMQENLSSLTGETRRTADLLNDSSANIMKATQEQAATLQQQSSALQQTTVTLEEIAQSAAQIADRAKDVASRVEATNQAADVGLDAVRRSQTATALLLQRIRSVSQMIAEMSERSQAIRNIIFTVNELTERSNILALNAAILASTVGPEGKAFALIANQIKILAEQSKDSNSSVRSLLGDVEKSILQAVKLTDDASHEVREGSEMAEQTDQAIRRLVEHIQDSSQAFQQIVAATNQQNLVFPQVTEALVSNRQAISQSASTIRTLEQEVAGLHKLSQRLQVSLQKFKLDSSA